MKNLYNLNIDSVYRKAKQNFIILELCCTYGNTKQQRITPLYLLSEENTLPCLFTFVKLITLTIMKKKQGKALVTSVEIPDALVEYNEANGVVRARIVFTFNSPVESDKDDITSMLASRTGNQTYSIIIDITDMGANESAALKAAKAAIEGKQATFTVFSWDISELNTGGEIIVNNGEREYSSLSDPYIGDNADDESSRTRMVNRLARDIESGALEFGSILQEEKSKRDNTFRRMR